MSGNTGLLEWRPLNGRPGLPMAVWCKSVGAGLAYVILAVRRLCLWHKSAAAVCGLWRYKRYMPAPMVKWSFSLIAAALSQTRQSAECEC